MTFQAFLGAVIAGIVIACVVSLGAYLLGLAIDPKDDGRWWQ
jgi:hypothetical protein